MKDYLSIPICDDILDAKRCPTPEMRSFTRYDYTSNDNSNKLKHSFPNKIKRAYLVQCANCFLIIFLERREIGGANLTY